MINYYYKDSVINNIEYSLIDKMNSIIIIINSIYNIVTMIVN